LNDPLGYSESLAPEARLEEKACGASQVAKNLGWGEKLLRPHDAHAFLDDNPLVALHAFDNFFPAARPLDLKKVNLPAGSQPEMQSEVVLRAETSAAPDLLDHAVVSDLDPDAGADSAAIRLGGDELDEEGVVPAGGGIV